MCDHSYLSTLVLVLNEVIAVNLLTESERVGLNKVNADLNKYSTHTYNDNNLYFM